MRHHLDHLFHHADQHRVAARLGVALLDLYVRHCERRAFTDQTIRNYRILIRRWLDYASDQPSAGEAQTFIDRHDDPGTRATYASWLRSFTKWATAEGHYLRDPMLKLDAYKAPAAVPRPISETDLARALITADARLRCWLLLGAKTGLRAKEIAGLRVEDLDLGADPQTLYVSNPKGSSFGIVPLHPDVLDALRTWGLPESGYVFPSPIRSFISPGHVSDVVARHLHGLEIDATLHKTRHRFGTRVYRATKDIRLTQQALRHASVATTQGYTRVVVDDLAAHFGSL